MKLMNEQNSKRNKISKKYSTTTKISKKAGC